MKLFFSVPDRQALKRTVGHCVTAGGALLLALAGSVLVYHAGLLALGLLGSDWSSRLLLHALLWAVLGVALVWRRRVPPFARGVLRLVASLLGFPVMYVRDNVWPTFFTVAGLTIVGTLGAFYFNVGNSVLLTLLAMALTATIGGVLYHVVQHRFAGYIGLGVAAAMIATGVFLLRFDAPQTAAYNVAMQANAVHNWDAQNKLLEASIGGYERGLRSGQLSELLFPTPQTDLAALAHFHKANGLLQTPGKGKEAYMEYCKSLFRNPGNRYIGLSPEDAARRFDNALHTQRNIEKLMRSGQDGGAGQPNGKQGQGKPQDGKGKQPSRDPGKEPQPSNGRHPRDVL